MDYVVPHQTYYVETCEATGHQLLASIIYSNYSPVAISLNSPVIYKTGMLDVGTQTCFPSQFRQACTKSFDPAEQELINTRRQLDHLNRKILKIQFKRFTTVTKVLHYLLHFIQSLLLTWIWIHVSPSFSHSQVSGISLRMVKLPKHVAFVFISHKDYLTCTD
jgi:hypothetical protein